MKKYILAAVLVCGQAFAGEGVFYSESFENSQPRVPWVGADGQNRKWDVWPKEAAESASISSDVRIGKFSLLLTNATSDSIYFRSHDQGKNQEWREAAASAPTVYANFRFYIPKEMQDHPGSVFNVYFEQQAADAVVGAFLSVANDLRQGGLVIMASNGSGNGFVAWQKVGTWSCDQWISVAVEQRFPDRKYNVTVGSGQPVKDLTFRNADSWEGDTWGEKSQVKFSVSPGAKVYLDDIVFSTQPIEEATH